MRMTDADKTKSTCEGLQILADCLRKAQKADPNDAPMWMFGRDAELWHKAQAEAYRHALEMLNASSFGIK